jgi:hypothetical protein
VAAYLLFHPYDLGNRPTTFAHADFWCGKFDLLPAIVHQQSMHEPSPRSGVPIFPSLLEALAGELFARCCFVWLDEAAVVTLDRYHHPPDDVVYVLGQEQDGFGDCPTEGDHVRVHFPGDPEGIASPSMIVPLLCYDRWAYLHGGRG